MKKMSPTFLSASRYKIVKSLIEIVSPAMRHNVSRLRAVGDLEPNCCHRKQMQFRKTIDKLTTKTPIDFSRCYAFVAFPHNN
jgi:hypothetical protein